MYGRAVFLVVVTCVYLSFLYSTCPAPPTPFYLCGVYTIFYSTLATTYFSFTAHRVARQRLRTDPFLSLRVTVPPLLIRDCCEVVCDYQRTDTEPYKSPASTAHMFTSCARPVSWSLWYSAAILFVCWCSARVCSAQVLSWPGRRAGRSHLNTEVLTARLCHQMAAHDSSPARCLLTAHQQCAS